MPKAALIIGTTKQCGKCKQFLSFQDFFKDNTKKCGLESTCKNCKKKKETTIEWRTKYREYRKNYTKNLPLIENNLTPMQKEQLKSKYNLSIEEYFQMLENQEGVCAICRKPETAVDKRKGSVKMLSVDHHHESNRVRGLLCGKCNMAIGLLKEDIKILESAIEYLKNN